MKNTMNRTDGAGSKRLHRAVDVRIAFAVLSILGGAGLPLYLAAWALIPEEGSDVAIAEAFFRPAGGATS